ncbi:hypothetical protein B9Z55_028071 [Caenorhabditis nigoni]|uniref:DOMON domain-containing protein n=1 Tax=Caenorhabditis nigoni TaxID=1611254 RepID=A0A2G5SDQ1_9PELO|nr:hypothetical protein B9Z55_028071 [Caenorhabditis nigoni]
MILDKLCFLAFFVSVATATIKCSGQHSCYAESPECDPNTDCQTVLRFDPSGNVNIFVRNMSVTDYVSIVTDQDLLNTMEFFVCVPFAGQRLRGLGRFGQTILINQQNLTNVVEQFETNSFRCVINQDELKPEFRSNKIFIVSRGRFQQFMRVNEGFKLYKLKHEEDLEGEQFLPAAYKTPKPLKKTEIAPPKFEEVVEISKMLQSVKQMFVDAVKQEKMDKEHIIHKKSGSSGHKRYHPKKDSYESDKDTKQNKAKLVEESDESRHVGLKKFYTPLLSLFFQDKSRDVIVSKARHHKKPHKTHKSHKNQTISNKSEEVMSPKMKPVANDDDLDTKVYVRMTKKQMYTFIDGLEEGKSAGNQSDLLKSNASTLNSEVEEPRNSATDDEIVFVLMTKRQMHTMIGTKAEHQVSGTKMFAEKRNYAGHGFHFGTTLLLLSALLFL